MRTMGLVAAAFALAACNVAAGEPAVAPDDPGAEPADAKIGADCTFHGKALHGRVQVVDHFADFQVHVVDHFADLNVQWVDHFPDGCGQWQKVDHFPDFTITYVDHFADLDIANVDHFPGLP